MNKEGDDAIRRAGMELLEGKHLPEGVKIVGGFFRVGGVRRDIDGRIEAFQFAAEKHPGDAEAICPPNQAKLLPTIEVIPTAPSTALFARCFGRLIDALRSLVRSARAAGASFSRGKR